jgi:hypothetical protein
MTLAKLSSRLEGNTDLVASTSEGGLGGRWKSLQTGTLKTLRVEGEFIYGDQSNPDGSSHTYDRDRLRQQSAARAAKPTRIIRAGPRDQGPGPEGATRECQV